MQVPNINKMFGKIGTNQQRAMRDELAWFKGTQWLMSTRLLSGQWVARYVRCSDAPMGFGDTPDDACIDLLGRLGAV